MTLSWRFRSTAFALVGWMATICGGVALAEPAPAAKTTGPPASRQLKKAFQALAKSDNYTLRATVLGGLADNPEHRVTNVTVRENYTGNVFNLGRTRLMEVPSIRAYKSPEAGRGVIYHQGRWIRVLSIDPGVKMDRLLYFPERILADAAKYSRSARWLEKKEVAEGFNYGDDGEAESDEDAGASDGDVTSEFRSAILVEDDEKGKTVVKKSKDDKKKSFQPRVLRVTAPPRAALKHWILQVENSGCMTEG